MFGKFLLILILCSSSIKVLASDFICNHLFLSPSFLKITNTELWIKNTTTKTQSKVRQRNLSLKGPLGPKGPLSEMGPIGKHWWNPAVWWLSAVEKNAWELAPESWFNIAGPLSKWGPLGILGPVGHTKKWRPMNHHILGTKGPLGALGPLGPLGVMGAIASNKSIFGPDQNGVYFDKNTNKRITKVDIKIQENSIREYDIHEWYTYYKAKELSDTKQLDDSFTVDIDLYPLDLHDEFWIHVDQKKLITVLIVPEQGLGMNQFGFLQPVNAGLEIFDSNMNLIVDSNSLNKINFVQIASKAEQNYKIRINKLTYQALPKSFRLIIVSAPSYLFTDFPL